MSSELLLSPDFICCPCFQILRVCPLEDGISKSLPPCFDSFLYEVLTKQSKLLFPGAGQIMEISNLWTLDQDTAIFQQDILGSKEVLRKAGDTRTLRKTTNINSVLSYLSYAATFILSKKLA